MLDITCTVSTRGRYFDFLPLALMSIVNQTELPKKLIIFDDNDITIDLRENPVYKNIFLLLSQKGVSWEVVFGGKKGQVTNHQKAIEMCQTEFVYRFDDDHILAPDCLAKLLSNVADDVAAIGGLVLDPKYNYRHLNPLASNKIEDIYLGLNIQWFKWEGIKEVDHLYSTFIYRKEVAEQVGGYCMELSKIGHREETIFTYTMKKAGYKLLVDSSAVTWHMKAEQGGIRSESNASMAQHDESIFRTKLQEWGVTPKDIKLCVLDCGLGDHLVFKKLLPELKNKYSNIVMAVCYPEVFEDDKNDITLISIANAQQMLNIDEFNLYKYLWENVNRKMTLEQAYKELYKI